MAYIKVDHKKLSDTASAFSAYTMSHRMSMMKMEGQMIRLSSVWKGEDYAAVKREWDEMSQPDSVSVKMVEAMRNYAKFLRSSANAYKEAQSRAYNRADKLSKD